ncbi:MAG: biosynthetic-type acetolactate synthase large subunit [Firmicutes bacterium]|nr:biosynthetic-type acetolactate synthase large subunit [Alicyclobacillaceae bacterium]MCL6497562.1 biosynthetic-type acetolactate synthase large subunit [Bacillota bacterium]
MNGAQWTWNVLKQLGVDTIFGIPGGAILPLVDAMVAEHPDLRFIVTRHEAAAIHAADGYARVSGRPGVVLVTSGPGGTNVVTGLATAMTDSVPLVVLIGQVPTPLIGTDAFQEADLFSMTMPIVKHSWRITRPQEIAGVLEQAVRVATSGRPGPVAIEFPKDMQLAEVPDARWEPSPAPEPTAWVRPLEWARVRSLLRYARRPVLYVGGGVTASDTAHWVRQIAERYQIPVTTTLMGLGTFPGLHPLSLGMLGMHGTWTANHAMQEADLILALGVRFDDRVTGKVDQFAPHAKIVHAEVDPAEVGKIVRPHVVLRGDLRCTLPRLARLAEPKRHDAWLAQLERWKAEHPLKVGDEGAGLSAPKALSIIARYLNDDDPVVTEVGQHQMWAALVVPRGLPRRFITSGGAGTMGYGFPAAMGAQLGHPRGRVCLLAGDGSFQMNLQEMATLAQYQLPIWVIIINNLGHGMVRQWQDLFHGERRHGVFLLNPDFVKLAEAFGIPGFSVNQAGALEEALAVMQRIEGPVVLEVVVPEDEHVYPMVPAGQPLSMVLEG